VVRAHKEKKGIWDRKNSPSKGNCVCRQRNVLSDCEKTHIFLRENDRIPTRKQNPIAFNEPSFVQTMYAYFLAEDKIHNTLKSKKKKVINRV
jgi:hypothetical protein